MRLYIPEIGDTLTLAADWEFTLHKESRNMELWAAVDAESHPMLDRLRKELDNAREEMAVIVGRMYEEPVVGRLLGMPTTRRAFYSKEDERRAYELRDKIYHLEHSATVPLTLPRRTVLSVDRIYVRKGASDYSSVSFYIQSTSLVPLQPTELQARGFKKGKKRFWAKLSDVNTIQFENSC